MTLEAYIDESFEEDGVFVLGGCIADTESWVEFSKKWENILSSAGLPDKDGEYYFKMSDMNLTDERKERIPAFYWIIEDHVHGFVSAKIDISELKRAQSRIIAPSYSEQIDWGRYANPYYMAFHCLLYKFHWARHHKSKDFRIDEKEEINFIFDDKSEKNAILSGWDDFIGDIQDLSKKYYGAAPRFEDDKKLLPLQAADFWAWWVRKWYIDGTPERIPKRDFGFFETKKGIKEFLFADITYDEDALTTVYSRILYKMVGDVHPIYDQKVS